MYFKNYTKKFLQQNFNRSIDDINRAEAIYVTPYTHNSSKNKITTLYFLQITAGYPYPYQLHPMRNMYNFTSIYLKLTESTCYTTIQKRLNAYLYNHVSHNQQKKKLNV